MFLYWTGARKGEVQAITWKDIDFKNDLIQINKTLSNKIKGDSWKITNTKNRKNRTIALLPQLKPILLEWRKH
ncbi:MAG: tyrosine-type recombinase/integrase [Bacilli bacterium]